MRGLLLISTLLLTGCNSTELPPLERFNNRASLKFSLRGKEYRGVTTHQRALVGINIDILAPKDTRLVRIDSCSRDHIIVDVREGVARYHFDPVLIYETEASCLMVMNAVTKHGYLYTGIIDWTDAGRLKAKTICNGDKQDETGVGICQNRAGKPVWVEFKEEVVWGKDQESGCQDPSPRTLPSNSYEIILHPGFCSYSFRGLESGERFRFTTYGYTVVKETDAEATE